MSNDQMPNDQMPNDQGTPLVTPNPGPPYMTEGLRRWRYRTNTAFFLFAAASIPLLLLELTWADLPANERVAIYVVNVVVTAVFAVDYLTELRLASNRWAYIRSEWLLGVVVVASALTLLPVSSLVGGLRAFAILRFARAFIGLVRVVSVGATVFVGGKAAIRRRVTTTIFEAAAFVWVTSAAAFALAEGIGPDGKTDSVADALWWSLIAMVPGAGPKVPAETLAGRGIYLLCVGTGLVVFSVLVARISAIFTDDRSGGGSAAP